MVIKVIYATNWALSTKIQHQQKASSVHMTIREGFLCLERYIDQSDNSAAPNRGSRPSSVEKRIW
jgi:hypothetical protein